MVCVHPSLPTYPWECDWERCVRIKKPFCLDFWGSTTTIPFDPTARSSVMVDYWEVAKRAKSTESSYYQGLGYVMVGKLPFGSPTIVLLCHGKSWPDTINEVHIGSGWIRTHKLHGQQCVKLRFKQKKDVLRIERPGKRLIPFRVALSFPSLCPFIAKHPIFTTWVAAHRRNRTKPIWFHPQYHKKIIIICHCGFTKFCLYAASYGGHSFLHEHMPLTPLPSFHFHPSPPSPLSFFCRFWVCKLACWWLLIFYLQPRFQLSWVPVGPATLCSVSARHKVMLSRFALD